MLNLVWLRSFVALVHHKSFQAAGDALDIAQPTVSLHIQKLEGFLGVLLIQRGRLGCQPTREARSLLPIAESMLLLNERAKRAVNAGSTRVGASSNIGIYLLNPHIKSFLKDSGTGGFDVVIDNNPQIASKLVNGEVDVGLMEWWQPRAGFQSKLWRQEPLALIVPPDHSYAHRDKISKHELQTMELLGGETGTGTARAISRYIGKTASLPKVSMQLGSTEAVKQAVKAGLGVSLVLASSVAEEVRNGSLCAIPLEAPGVMKDLIVIWRDSPGAQDSIPTFVEHLCLSAVLLKSDSNTVAADVH